MVCEVHGEAILLLSKDCTLLSKVVDGGCLDQYLHAVISYIDQVKCLTPRSYHKRERLLIKAWQWIKPILLVVARCRILENVNDLPVLYGQDVGGSHVDDQSVQSVLQD